MRKTLIALVLLFSTFATVHAQNAQSDNDAKIVKLAQGVEPTDLIHSPDGKWMVFVKKSNYIVPSNCFYAFARGDRANEIWIIDTNKITKKLLVAPHFDCRNVSKAILDPHNLQFSPDSKTLYFETSAWVTSGAVHAVNVHGKHLRFVTDGSELHVVQSGSYKGDLIINQHRYRFRGDTPLGSYNWDWLFTPTGKQIKLYKKED
jgi:hypothetical protein